MEFEKGGLDPISDNLQSQKPGHKRNQSQQPLIGNQDKDQSVDEDLSNFNSNKKLLDKKESDEDKKELAGPKDDVDKKETSEEEEEDSEEEDEEDDESSENS